MPELPEVEKAIGILNTVAAGKCIKAVEAFDDNIVFLEITAEQFAKEITGRAVEKAFRYGKYFYLALNGKGKMPVLHFGMTGMLQVKGELATYYKETPRSASTDWPPRFVKFILHLVDDTTGETAELAFLDARRLGRIRLCTSPLTESPIADLGFDPILSMPSLDVFKPLVLKRSCPIKALLLDQSFNAGVGNWVADEILYHARVHPEQRCNTLTAKQLAAVHFHTSEVCRIAVSVNADDSKYPDHWLFKHRWGKGKKEKHILKLPSGKPATIDWVTVGGRTSAYVVELQLASGSTTKVRDKRNSGGAKDNAEINSALLSDLKDEVDLKPNSETSKTLKRKRGSRFEKERKKVRVEN